MKLWATGISPQAMPQTGVAAPNSWPQTCFGWLSVVSESPVVCRLVFLAPLRWGGPVLCKQPTFGPPYLCVFFAVALLHQCFPTCVRAHFHWRPSGSLEPVAPPSVDFTRLWRSATAQVEMRQEVRVVPSTGQSFEQEMHHTRACSVCERAA